MVMTNSFGFICRSVGFLPAFIRFVPHSNSNRTISTVLGKDKLSFTSLTRLLVAHHAVHSRSSCYSTMATSQQMSKYAQYYDYFLVLDFEATCDKPRNPVPQEIIEFPVLKVSGRTFNTESVFHRYVKPKAHSNLSTFCTELTGIIQEMVDNEQHLDEVLKDFDQWLVDEKLKEPSVKFCFVTCGDWDLRVMLPGQCEYFGYPLPQYMTKWINIKKSFAEITSVWPKNLPGMLQQLGLNMVGRHHSGIDDCRNIALVLKALSNTGYTFRANGRYTPREQRTQANILSS